MNFKELWEMYDKQKLDQHEYIKNTYGYTWEICDGLIFYPNVPYFQYCTQLIRKELPECPVYIIDENNLSDVSDFINKYPNAVTVLYAKEENLNTLYHDFLSRQSGEHIYRVITYKDLGNILPLGTSKTKYFDFYRKSEFLASLSNRQNIEDAFNLLSDSYSKNLYIGILKRYIFSSNQFLPIQSMEKQYFGEDFVRFSSEDVFVDCGAYDGDTLKQFLKKRIRDFGRYIAYEPDEYNFMKMVKFTESLSDEIKSKIDLYPYGVGKYNRTSKFMADGEASSKYSEDGDQIIKMVRLDSELCNIEPSIIKMDIEGNEIFALYGLEKTIQRCTPTLIVCAYHTPMDFWAIPLLINGFNSNYSFYLRAYSEYEEYVLYAIPNKEDKKNASKSK